MKKFTLLLFTLLIVVSSAFAQQMVSATYLGTKSKSEIGDIVGNPLFTFMYLKYGADYYKLLYESKDAKGKLDTLSALLVVPKDEVPRTYPVLFYEHGTSSCKECVPSRYGQPGGEEGMAGFLFAGVGYTTLMPDYVGMGDGRGFQTYIHEETTFRASDDLMQAYRAWAPNNNIQNNEQVFISGYSQGGYASMSFQKGMQQKYGAQSVTAAAHGSGPYSLSGVMRDLILSDTPYGTPAYIPNTILGMNEVYEMFTDFSDFFKPEFVPDVQAYYRGEIDLYVLNQRLINTLTTNYGAPIGRYMIQDAMLDNLRNKPDHILNQILRENDVLDWKPESPTRLFYCKGDDQVPYMNSVVALDSMLARGASISMIQAVDVNPTANHTGCIPNVFVSALSFFDGYKSITTDTEDLLAESIAIYPNPAQDRLFVNAGGRDIANVKIWDLNGSLRMDLSTLNLADGIDLTRFVSGIYVLQITEKTGNVSHHKFVVKK